MSNLKEKISNICLTLKKSITKFPLTIITIIVLTLICVLNLEEDFIKGNVLENIIFFAITFANSTFLIETLIENKTKRNIFYIIPIIISAIFTYINAEPTIIKESFSMSFLNWFRNVYISYMLSIVIISIYYNYKRSNKTFQEYVTSVFVNAFKATLVYGILSIGIALISAIFVYLILDSSDYVLVLRMELLVLGIYYIPTMLYTFYNIEEQTSKFSKVIVKYILGSLVIVSFVIIYIYIIKIIVLRDMPSNQIFRILAVLFILGCPIWTMIEKFKEGTIIDKINNLLPVLFIPFIILQMYSIGIRISSNGITEGRYLCIMLIIFEIIYTIVRLTKKEHISKVLLVIPALIIISEVLPYVNMYNVSRVSQFNNLKIFKEKTEYTDEEIEKITGAYYYLSKTDEGGELIDSILTDDKKKEIYNLKNESNQTQPSFKYISGYKDHIQYLDISKYNSLYTVSASNSALKYNSTEKTIDEVFSKLEMTKEETGEKIEVNISSIIKECIQESEINLTSYNILENISNEIILDENRTLILINISINYNNDLVKDYDLLGYILEK